MSGDSRIAPEWVVCQIPENCFKPANLFLPNFQRKRFKIKQIGRFKSVYLV